MNTRLNSTKLLIVAAILLLLLVVGVTLALDRCAPAGFARDAGASSPQGTGGDSYYLDEEHPLSVNVSVDYGVDDDDDGEEGYTPKLGSSPNTLYYGNRSWAITNDPSAESLKKHPAFQAGADDPDTDKMCVILGRDTDKQFKCFGSITVGAIVKLLYDGVLYSYRVTDSGDMFYPKTTVRVLVIVTYHGDDPTAGKQVVYCEPVT